MRTFGLASALVWLTFLQVPALHATQAPDALRDHLLAITQAWVDAIPQGRQDVWRHTLTDDAVIIDEFGRIQHKQDAVASLRPFPPGLSGSIELRDPHVQQYGDTALLQVEQYERENVFGQQLTVRYQSLLTFVKHDGMWKLAGAEDVTIPTAPPQTADQRTQTRRLHRQLSLCNGPCMVGQREGWCARLHHQGRSAVQPNRADRQRRVHGHRRRKEPADLSSRCRRSYHRTDRTAQVQRSASCTRHRDRLKPVSRQQANDTCRPSCTRSWTFCVSPESSA